MTNSFLKETGGEGKGTVRRQRRQGTVLCLRMLSPVFLSPNRKKQRENIYNSVNLSTLFWIAF